jgi:hypothetical protein
MLYNKLEKTSDTMFEMRKLLKEKRDKLDKDIQFVESYEAETAIDFEIEWIDEVIEALDKALDKVDIYKCEHKNS